jgi:flagellar biosynthetic protein FlhB
VAKGADRLAAKIRRTAYRHGVLVTEDKPLARALYRRCKVGGFVPAALYEAVAVVLAAAYRRGLRPAPVQRPDPRRPALQRPGPQRPGSQRPDRSAP